MALEIYWAVLLVIIAFALGRIYSSLVDKPNGVRNRDSSPDSGQPAPEGQQNQPNVICDRSSSVKSHEKLALGSPQTGQLSNKGGKASSGPTASPDRTSSFKKGSPKKSARSASSQSLGKEDSAGVVAFLPFPQTRAENTGSAVKRTLSKKVAAKSEQVSENSAEKEDCSFGIAQGDGVEGRDVAKMVQEEPDLPSPALSEAQDLSLVSSLRQGDEASEAVAAYIDSRATENSPQSATSASGPEGVSADVNPLAELPLVEEKESEPQVQPGAIVTSYSKAQVQPETVVTAYSKAQVQPKAVVTAYSKAQVQPETVFTAHSKAQVQPKAVVTDYSEAQVQPEAIVTAYSKAQVQPETVVTAYSKAQVQPKTVVTAYSKAQVQPEAVVAFFSKVQVQPEAIVASYSKAQVQPEDVVASYTKAQVQPKAIVASYPQAQVHPKAIVTAYSKAKVQPEAILASYSKAQVQSETILASYSKGQVQPEAIVASYSKANEAFTPKATPFIKRPSPRPPPIILPEEAAAFPIHQWNSPSLPKTPADDRVRADRVEIPLYSPSCTSPSKTLNPDARTFQATNLLSKTSSPQMNIPFETTSFSAISEASSSHSMRDVPRTLRTTSLDPHLAHPSFNSAHDSVTSFRPKDKDKSLKGNSSKSGRLASAGTKSKAAAMIDGAKNLLKKSFTLSTVKEESPTPRYMYSKMDGEKRASSVFRTNKITPTPVMYAVVHPKPYPPPSASPASKSKPDDSCTQYEYKQGLESMEFGIGASLMKTGARSKRPELSHMQLNDLDSFGITEPYDRLPSSSGVRNQAGGAAHHFPSPSRHPALTPAEEQQHYGQRYTSHGQKSYTGHGPWGDSVGSLSNHHRDILAAMATKAVAEADVSGSRGHSFKAHQQGDFELGEENSSLADDFGLPNRLSLSMSLPSNCDMSHCDCTTEPPPTCSGTPSMHLPPSPLGPRYSGLSPAYTTPREARHLKDHTVMSRESSGSMDSLLGQAAAVVANGASDTCSEYELDGVLTPLGPPPLLQPMVQPLASPRRPFPAEPAMVHMEDAKLQAISSVNWSSQGPAACDGHLGSSSSGREPPSPYPAAPRQPVKVEGDRQADVAQRKAKQHRAATTSHHAAAAAAAYAASRDDRVLSTPNSLLPRPQGPAMQRPW